MHIVPYVFHFLKGIPTPSSGAVVLLCPKCDRRGALHWARRDLSHEEKRWFDLFCCCCSSLNRPAGNVVLYDATAKRETVKISNSTAPGAALLQDNSDYQLFVNGKEQICVMQVICFLNIIVWQITCCRSRLRRLPVAGTSMCTPILWVGLLTFKDVETG